MRPGTGRTRRRSSATRSSGSRTPSRSRSRTSAPASARRSPNDAACAHEPASRERAPAGYPTRGVAEGAREHVAIPAEDAWRPERAAEIIAAGVGREGATLPILQALQDAFGHIPEAAIPMVAEALNLTRAEVHGIVGFYRDFRREPPGRHVLRLCRAEACQSRGAEALAAQA